MSERDLIEAAANRYAATLIKQTLEVHQNASAAELRRELMWVYDVLLDLARRSEAAAGKRYER